jgi:hypothetical protein
MALREIEVGLLCPALSPVHIAFERQQRLLALTSEGCSAAKRGH